MPKGWSPPKKVTYLVSIVLEIIGFILGLIASGIIPVAGISLNQIWLMVSLILLLIGWLLLLIGILFRGV